MAYFTLLCWLCCVVLCCACDVSSFLFALRIPTYLSWGRRGEGTAYLPIGTWNLEGGKDVKIRLSQSNLLPTIKIDNLLVLYNINLDDGYINTRINAVRMYEQYSTVYYYLGIQRYPSLGNRLLHNDMDSSTTSRHPYNCCQRSYLYP